MTKASFSCARTNTARIAATLLLATAAAPLLVRAQTAAGANDAAIEQAKQMLGDERFVEALGVARDAARNDPSDYRAQYYVAMAYMGLRQYETAEAEAATALRLAPASAQSAVEKLVATIKSLRQGTTNLSAADTALAEGLIGKAARLYEEAWGVSRNAPDFALKAADLYSNRLNQPVDAARVLRQVQQSMAGSVAADSADAELKKLAPKLREIATARVAQARLLPWTEASVQLDAAEAADPSFADVYTTRAQLAALSGSTDLVQVSIKELARRNLITVDEVAGLANMNKMLAQPPFAQFVNDVMGPAQAAAVTSAASPNGRAAYLTRIGQEGDLTFFFGAKPQGNGFMRYSRRKVAGVKRDADCQMTVFYGDVLKYSEDMGNYVPPSRIVDIRRLVLPLKFSGQFLDFGKANDGWDTHGFVIEKGGALGRRVTDAVVAIIGACPPPAAGKRR